MGTIFDFFSCSLLRWKNRGKEKITFTLWTLKFVCNKTFLLLCGWLGLVDCLFGRSSFVRVAVRRFAVHFMHSQLVIVKKHTHKPTNSQPIYKINFFINNKKQPKQT